jgi:hypothetical protein
MKTLTQTINENLYNINNYIKEELDDNLLYMIDMWLERNDEERQEFIELISKCKTDHIININKLKNFVDNDIEADTEKDYYNKLKSILEQVIANKSKYNKYNK